MGLRVFCALFLPGLILVASTTAANAYMGPGAGLSAIGSLLSLIGALFLAIVGFIWYPLKRLLRRSKPAIANSRDNVREHDAAPGR